LLARVGILTFEPPSVAIDAANYVETGESQNPHPNVEQHDVRMGHPRDCGWI